MKRKKHTNGAEQSAPFDLYTFYCYFSNSVPFCKIAKYSEKTYRLFR